MPAGVTNEESGNYHGRRVLWASRRLSSADTVLGEARYQAGGDCGPRVQRDVQLVVVWSGSCQAVINGVTIDPPVGWVLRLLPRQREFLRFSQEAETHHAWLAVRSTAVPIRLRRQLAEVTAMTPCSPVFHHLLDTALSLAAPLEEASAAVLDQLGLCLLAEYRAMALAWQHRAAAPTPVERARAYMEKFFSGVDCLEAAQAAAGISRNSLITHFHSACGLTPARYLWRLRTERGVAMLGETGLSIAEIAERCGFSDPFHFTRLVKRLQGISPRALRQQLWAINEKP